MPGITGIQPLNGIFVWEDPSQDAFTLQGGPANPAHGQPLVSKNQPYPSDMYQWGGAQSNTPDCDYIDTNESFPSAGVGGPTTPYYDATPQTHAGPWPKRLPDGLTGQVGPEAMAYQAQVSASLHADGMDNAKPSLIISALQDIWKRVWNPNPNSPNLQQAANGQNKFSSGGWGSTDYVTNQDGHNDFDYGSTHMMRRYGAGSVPGAYMWMKPGGRPLVGFVAGPARPPTGTGPFEGQDIGEGFTAYPGVLTQPAGAYQSPADPYQPATLTQQNLIEAPLGE